MVVDEESLPTYEKEEVKVPAYEVQRSERRGEETAVDAGVAREAAGELEH